VEAKTQMMRSTNLKREEKGQVLMLMAVILALAGLVLGPLMGFAYTGHQVGQIREDDMHRVYAADLGIEDVMYQIANEVIEIEPGDQTDYTFGEAINDSAVEVSVYRVYDDTYSIISTATDHEGVTTVIEAYVEYWDYRSLLKKGLSSYGNITIQPGADIWGDVQYMEELVNQGNIYGEETQGGIKAWPTAEELSQWYLNYESLGACSSGVLNVQNGETVVVGPCSTDGNLTIKGQGTVEFGGTFYVAGDLIFNPTPKLTIVLNGHSIYAEGIIEIGPKCDISGPGCIIAEGDVQFQPNQIGDDFIFVMSIEGSVTAQPGGDFVGSFAASINIQVQPGTSLTWECCPTEFLNFPKGPPHMTLLSYVIEG